MMLRSLGLVALLTTLLTSPALAQEEEGGLLSVSGGLMIWTILIFLIVLAVLYKAAYPHILGAVEAREARIRELLDAAARDRQEAQAAREEQQRQLDEMRARVQEMMAEGRSSAERLREDLLAQARREQEEMLARTRREIQQEMERSLEQVRADAVDLAIAAASRLVERNLDDAENRRLVREYLAQVDEQRGAAVPAGV